MLKRFNKIQIVVMALVLVVANLAFLHRADAATYLTHSSVIEYNMVASGNSEVAVAFTTASAGATSVAIGFGSWGGTVNSTQSVATAGCIALTGASDVLPGGSLAASGASNTITITGVTALAASTSYCVILSSASAVTNPTAGMYSVSITAGSDSSSTAIDVISNDQYTVSATVAPTFTMSLPSTTDSLGTLSATALTTSTGVTATVVTNAASGWFLWAEDSNAGLHSATQSKTIATVTPGSNVAMNGGSIGTEKYALGVTGVTNSGAATTNYADSAGTTGGGLSTTAFNEIATGTAPTASSAVSLKELADITGTTPAASDYTDVITVVGAGSF